MFDSTFIKGYFVVNNMHAANSIIHFVRDCPCSYCGGIHCNVQRNSPHEAEGGSNSIEAMTHGGYWSQIEQDGYKRISNLN